MSDDARAVEATSEGPGTAVPSRSFSEAPAAAHFARRNALKDAAFFLPHLRPGMLVLDCGCGPGTISVGLAELVAPGELVGIDSNDALLAAAHAHAQERGIANIRFEHADIYKLPFPDASFDAAIVSRVLEHLTNPVDALREVHRVLKPGGVVGVASPDYGGVIIAPIDPLLERWVAIHRGIRDKGGGNSLMGRFLRGAVVNAGFERVVGSATSDVIGDTESTAKAVIAVGDFMGGYWGRSAIGLGLADQETLDQIASAWRAWGERPDAFMATPHGEAVGWKPSGAS